jgi:hypothetical protein
MIRRAFSCFALVAALAASLAGCGQAAVESRTIPLVTLNSSGVTGNVTITAVDDRRTRVEIRVDPAGHPDMPSHIHPGTCTALVPQPKYPLQNVTDGHSVTVVPASFADLVKGGLAVNIHRSNQDLATYTACAELK